jgi:hypothetical protein
MKKEMIELLELLGFEKVTDPLWKHELVGYMTFDETTTVTDIVKGIYDRGFGECQALIRANIGIS